LKKLIKKHVEKIRFLLAGGWNTAFGYFSFAALYLLFADSIHYMILVIISNILSITNAFISYKFFVFKSKGPVIKEYLRFYLVYSFSIAAGLFAMPVMVEIFKVHPLIAQAAIIAATVIISYFGHKHFSFKGAHR
jgi:putative flippase GtrA